MDSITLAFLICWPGGERKQLVKPCVAQTGS